MTRSECICCRRTSFAALWPSECCRSKQQYQSAKIRSHTEPWYEKSNHKFVSGCAIDIYHEVHIHIQACQGHRCLSTQCVLDSRHGVIAKQPQGRKPACIPTNLGADFPDPWVPHRSEGAAGPTGNEQDRPRLQHSPENSQSRTKVKQHLFSQKTHARSFGFSVFGRASARPLVSGIHDLGHGNRSNRDIYEKKPKLLLILRKLSVAEKDT